MSRTFALGIEALPPALGAPVGISYLLCRVADTIEDETRLSVALRRDALAAWRDDVLRAAARPGAEAFGVADALVPHMPAPAGAHWPTASLDIARAADAELLARRADVLAEFSSLAPDLRRLIGAYVAEMAEGMALFVQQPGDRPTATFEDLDRYCYFVAGTVGHVLTGVFTAGAPALAPERLEVLRRSAEGFGSALQLVNIIKDARGDLAEGRCFVPRSMWPVGLDPDAPGLRAALLALCDLALERARVAQTYLIALPPDRLAARQFCALALHLALLTLRACRSSPRLVDPHAPIKISRAEVAAVASWVFAHCDDDRALDERFVALLEGAPAAVLSRPRAPGGSAPPGRAPFARLR